MFGRNKPAGEPPVEVQLAEVDRRLLALKLMPSLQRSAFWWRRVDQLLDDRLLIAPVRFVASVSVVPGGGS